MTDREAIRRMAEIVARVADCIPAELARADALALERDLSEPAAPTVTREQAIHFRNLLSQAMVSVVINGTQTTVGLLRLVFDRDDADPAFFRAVADALEGE